MHIVRFKKQEKNFSRKFHLRLFNGFCFEAL